MRFSSWTSPRRFNERFEFFKSFRIDLGEFVRRAGFESRDGSSTFTERGLWAVGDFEQLRSERGGVFSHLDHVNQGFINASVWISDGQKLTQLRRALFCSSGLAPMRKGVMWKAAALIEVIFQGFDCALGFGAHVRDCQRGVPAGIRG